MPFTRRVAGTASPATADALPTGVQVTTEELIRLRLAARDLRLGSRRPSLSTIAGAHASRFRGRGMDYLESRGYQSGDDIRNMACFSARAAPSNRSLPHAPLR